MTTSTLSTAVETAKKITGTGYYSKEQSVYGINLNDSEIKEVIQQNRLRNTRIIETSIPAITDENDIYISRNNKVMTIADIRDDIETRADLLSNGSVVMDALEETNFADLDIDLFFHAIEKIAAVEKNHTPDEIKYDGLLVDIW